jgi:FixJ family two-component response regulator
MLGETVLPKAILPLILEREDEMVPVKPPEDFAPPLSRRERLILRHLAEGLTNKVIATKIGIAAPRKRRRRLIGSRCTWKADCVADQRRAQEG